MTLIGRGFRDSSPWSSVWDWTPTGSMFGRFSLFDEFVHRPTFTDVRIPVEYYRDDYGFPRQSSSYRSDEWSDSDCECCDMNTNSRSRTSKPKQLSRSRKVSPASGNSRTIPVVINVDEDDEPYENRRKQLKYDLTESSSNIDDHCNYRLGRGKGRSVDGIDNGVIKIDDDADCESLINETSNYEAYQYLKSFLESTGRQIDVMKGDGNCFFRALSKVIYGSQKFYDEIRQAVVDVIEKHPKHFEAYADGPVKEHIARMREDKTWATQTEIYAAATLLNRDIYILSPDQSGDTYRWLLFSPLVKLKYNSNSTGCKCYVTICHTHGNHYDRIAAIGSDCNCGLDPPELSGVCDSMDLTADDEIV